MLAATVSTITIAIPIYSSIAMTIVAVTITITVRDPVNRSTTAHQSGETASQLAFCISAHGRNTGLKQVKKIFLHMQ